MLTQILSLLRKLLDTYYTGTILGQTWDINVIQEKTKEVCTLYYLLNYLSKYKIQIEEIYSYNNYKVCV